MSSATPHIKILQYRNGIYQGQVKGNKRNGYGILITDDNIIIVSQWKQDLISGKGLIFLQPDHYGYGEFNRGDIQGGFLFRDDNRTLFSQFNMSRPINKMVLIHHDIRKVQTIVHKTPIYEIQSQRPMTTTNQSQQIYLSSNIKFPCYSILQFVQKQFTRVDISVPYLKQLPFKLKSLNNGNVLFYLNDQTNPTSIGFCLNKNQQLISCGMYVNDKLTGLGCKYENGIRYQGMFQNGFMNGIGLKFGQGKYSFGEYSNGNLVQALYIDDRSSISQQKLQQFKKLQHIRSLWYENSYIRSNLIKYKGFNQLIFQLDSQHEYMYPQANNYLYAKKQNSIMQPPNPINNQYQRTNTKNINNTNLLKYSNTNFNQNSPNTNLNNTNYNLNNSNSNNKNLALNMLIKRQGDKLQTKSSKQYIGRLNQSNNIQQSGVRDNRAGNMFANMNAKTTIGYGQKQGYFKNPQYDDLDEQRSNQSNSGLRNLKKFKF